MRTLLCLLGIFIALPSNSQDGELDEHTAQALENMAERTEDALDDFAVDDYLHYIKHPINLNVAEEEELKALHLLNDLQIANLIRYRELLGPLIHIYELQAIPSWDVFTIKKVLPLVTIGGGNEKRLETVFLEGEQNLIIRYGNAIEPSKG